MARRVVYLSSPSAPRFAASHTAHLPIPYPIDPFFHFCACVYNSYPAISSSLASSLGWVTPFAPPDSPTVPVLHLTMYANPASCTWDLSIHCLQISYCTSKNAYMLNPFMARAIKCNINNAVLLYAHGAMSPRRLQNDRTRRGTGPSEAEPGLASGIQRDFNPSIARMTNLQAEVGHVYVASDRIIE